jgi:hypothetical protein
MAKKVFFGMSALLVVCLLSASLCFAESKASPAPADTLATPAAANHKVVVYYLYFTPRCETCLNMEAFSHEAIQSAFASRLADGTVEWHAYDTGKDEYKHFWDEFKLETKSLIMVDVQNGKPVRWKNCEKIWDLAGAKPDFMKYVQDEVKAYLTISQPEK